VEGKGRGAEEVGAGPKDTGEREGVNGTEEDTGAGEEGGWY